MRARKCFRIPRLRFAIASAREIAVPATYYYGAQKRVRTRPAALRYGVLSRRGSLRHMLLFVDESAHVQNLERILESHSGQHQRALHTDNQISKLFNGKAIRKADVHMCNE